MQDPKLSQAIRNAIDSERKAARFYRQLADKSQDPATRRFFERMVEVENRHAFEIEQHGRSLVGDLPWRGDAKLDFIETAPGWTDAEGIDVEAALRIALEAEVQASLYYDAFADALEEPGRSFFRGLSAAEEHHAEMIRRVLAGQPPGSP